MIFRGLGILAASLILTACGGSGGSGSSSIPPSIPDVNDEPLKELPEPSFSPEQKTVESIAFVDALNMPLASADVVFTPLNEVSNLSIAMQNTSIEEDDSCAGRIEESSLTDVTDEEGGLALEGLAPGVYRVNICKGEVNVSMQFTILSDNAAAAAVIAAPLTVNKDGIVEALPDNSLIVAVSGVIYSDKGIIANAQIAISGGALTNGAITTAVTDEDGFYSIVINVNASKLAALQNATIQIVAEGYERLNISGQNFTQFGAFSGINAKLIAADEATQEFVYQENFEVLASGTTCGEWTSETLVIEGNVFTPMNVEAPEEQSLWHTHVSGLDVINQAYLANLVSLAPNDLTAGKVPNPIEGAKACWYGKTADDNSLDEGNFLNEAENTGAELGGGTSIAAHSGALVSPRIDFSAEVAPLALTFKTWWEIEAVNPNENGFDLMSVEYQIEGEDDWVTFVRLNPLADPVGIDELESLPYSSAGFNQAPLWLEQAPISLDRLAGKVFQLRFTFSTQDELYNGFRGWLLDDVEITHNVGTFPLWDEVDRILINDDLSYAETFNDATEKTQFSISGTAKSLDSTFAQLRIYSIDGQPLTAPFAVTALVQGDLQGIQLEGDATKPEGEFKLVVELIDTSGQVKASYAFWSEDSFPELDPELDPEVNEGPQ